MLLQALTLVGIVVGVMTLGYAASTGVSFVRIWRAYAWLAFGIALCAVTAVRLNLAAGKMIDVFGLFTGAVLLPIAIADIRKAYWKAAQHLDLVGPPDAPDVGTFAYDITEYRSVEAFRREHDKHSGLYTYAFHPTGIADKKTVACSCGVTVDVSDYDAW